MAEIQSVRKRKEPEHPSSTSETNIDKSNETTVKRRNESICEFPQRSQPTNRTESENSFQNLPKATTTTTTTNKDTSTSAAATEKQQHVILDTVATNREEQQQTKETATNLNPTNDTYKNKISEILHPLGKGGLLTLLHSTPTPPTLQSPSLTTADTVDTFSSTSTTTPSVETPPVTQLYPSLTLIQHDNKISSPIHSTTFTTSTHFILLRDAVSDQHDRFKSTLIFLEEHHKFQSPWTEPSEFYRTVRSYFDSQLQLAQVIHEIQVNEEESRHIREHDVWIEKRDRITLHPAKCGDGTTLSPPSVETTWMAFNISKIQLLRSLLTKIKELKSERYTQILYSTQMSKLRMQYFVDEFLYQSHLFSPLKDLQTPHPVVALSDESREPADMLEVNTMKHYVDVLFSFIRDCENLITSNKQRTDQSTSYTTNAIKELCEDLQFCTTKLLSVWLRKATYSDHVYILNHLLETPNIHQWGAHFLQFSDAQNWQHRDIHHFLTMFHVFLCPVVKSLAIDSQQQDKRIVVPVLSEEDYIALFKQFPFALLYHYLFGSSVASDKLVDNALMTFDICDSLVSILTTSFSSFTFQSFNVTEGETPQLLYRDFLKRIAETLLDLIRHVALFTGSLVEQLKSSSFSSQIPLINSHWERLFVKVFGRLLNQKSNGMWQFLVHLPYKSLSPSFAFNIFYLLFQSTENPLNDQLVESFCQMSLKEWNDILQCNQSLREVFVQKLVTTKDGEFLLHALTKLALVQPSHSFLSLIILSELFYVSYLNSQTRVQFHKPGREMISSIIRTHPRFMSDLLKLVDTHHVALGKGSLHLFKRLPLSAFVPTFDDLQLIEKWLLSPLDGNLCKLAQFIIEQLSWESTARDNVLEEKRLFLPNEVHRYIALILLRAYLHHKDQQSTTFISLQKTPHTQFFDWTLNAVLLPSHFTYPGERYLAPFDLNDPLVALLKKHLPSEEQLQTFTTQKSTSSSVSFPLDPLISYLSLQLTSIGHNLSMFKCYGLLLLKSLIIHRKYEFVLRVLYEVIPAAISSEFSESVPLRAPNDNICFSRDILVPLLHGEFSKPSSMRLWSYVSQLSFEKTKINEITARVAAMITSQIFIIFQRHSTQNREHVKKLLLFWLREIFEFEGWTKDDKTLYLVDSLFRCAIAMDAIEDAYHLLLSKQILRTPTKSRASGVIDWFLTSLKEGSKYLNELFVERRLQTVLYPWASFFILMGEAHTQQESWRQLGELIANKPSVSINTILNEFGGDKDWVIDKVLDRAMVMDPDHPLTVLFWQLFFVLYFSVNTSNGTFFAYKLFPSSNSKKSKRELAIERLDFLIQHHNSIIHRYRVLQNSQMSSTLPNYAISTTDVSESHTVQLSSSLVEYYRIMYEWMKLDLKEMNIHTLEHLSAQYAPFYLLALTKFGGPRDLWWQHIHNSGVLTIKLQKEHQNWLTDLHSLNTRLLSPVNQTSTKKSKTLSTTATGSDISHLTESATSISSVSKSPEHHLTQLTTSTQPHATISQYLQSNVLPSMMSPMKRPSDAESQTFDRSERSAPPPECSIQPPLIQPYPLTSNVSSLRSMLERDINTVLSIAEDYYNKMVQYVALDEELLELLPKLYFIELKKMQREIRCKKECLCPVTYTVEVREARKRLDIEQQLVQNRKRLAEISNFKFGVELCYSCLRVEKTLLLLQTKKHCKEEEALINFGVDLFYWVMSKQTSSNRFYPPCRVFLDFISVILAQTFLAGNPKEVTKMLQTIVKDHQFVSLLAPYFTPNVSIEQFGKLYEIVLAQVGRLDNSLIALLLNNFDLNEWLKKTKTERELHIALLHLIGSHLCDDPQKLLFPTSNNVMSASVSSSMPPSWLKCLEHMKTIALFAFPLYFNVVTQYVFDMSHKRILSESVWSLLLDLPLNTLTSSLLNTTFSWMSNYFLAMKKRREKRKLYASWGRYLKYLLQFIEQLLHALITNDPHFNDPQLCQSLLNLYEAWLFAADGSAVWSSTEVSEARIILESFVNTVTTVQRAYPHLQMMNKVWKWWSGKELQRHGLQQVQSQSNEALSSGLSTEQQLLITEQLLELPWETLSPQLDTPKEMLSLANFYALSSTNVRSLPFFKFIAHIVTRIDWSAFKPNHTTLQPSPTFSGYSSLTSSSPIGSPVKLLTVSSVSHSSTNEVISVVSTPLPTASTSELPLYNQYYSMLFAMCCTYLSAPFDDTRLQQTFDQFIFSRAVHYPWHLLNTSMLHDAQLIQKYIVDKFVSRVNTNVNTLHRLIEKSPLFTTDISLIEQTHFAERLNATLKFLHSVCGWNSIDSSTVNELLQRVDRLSLYLSTVVELLPLCFTKQNASTTLQSLYDMILNFATVVLLNRPIVTTTTTNVSTTMTSSITSLTTTTSPVVTMTTENSLLLRAEEAIVTLLRNVLVIYNKNTPLAQISELCTLLNNTELTTETTVSTSKDLNDNLTNKSNSTSNQSACQRSLGELSVYFLRAATLSIASESKQVPLIEVCLENDFVLNLNLNRLVNLLVVPDIGREAFLRTCVETKAILTLYVFCLQTMSRNDPLQLTKLSEKIFDWILHLNPPSPKEYKLFLLWDVAIQLSQFHVVHNLNVANIIKYLERLSERMLSLSEDRQGKGLLGFLNFGEKSPYPLEFRLTCRILSLFLMVQLQGEQLRLNSTDPFKISSSVQRRLDSLRALHKKDNYAAYQFLLQSAVNFIINPEKTIAHFRNLLHMVTSALFKHPAIKALFF